MKFNEYPYLNLTDLNIDYILNAIKEMHYEVTNFVSINAIKYADPIQWSIIKQYEKNTIVIDPVTGTAYISVAAVPAGVSLSRPEYWTVVFDLSLFIIRAAQNFTSHWESDTTLTATFPTNAGGWLVWGDVLYKALVNITAGDSYVVGGNIEHFTIEDLYNAYLNTIAQILAMIGDLVDLNTVNKTDLVAAINEVVGNLSQETTDRVNEINRIDLILANRRIYNVIDYGATADGVTDDSSAFADCIAAAHGNGVVYIPNGNYVVNTTLTLTGGDYILSHGAIISSNTIPLSISGKYNVINGLQINNASVAIDIGNAFITTIINVNTYRCGVGIRVKSGSYGISVFNCNIYNSVNSGVLYDTGGASNLANGLSLIRVNMDTLDGDSEPINGGIVCISGEGLYIVNCEIIRQRYGLKISPDSALEGCKYYKVSNSVFDLCYANGIYIGGANGSIYDVSLSDTWSSTSGGAGILVESSGADIEVIKMNSMSCNNNNIGIRLKQDSGVIKDVIISDSTLVSNSAIGSGIHDAIIVEGYISDVNIINNLIDGAILGYLNDNNHGINVGANTNNIVIKDNIIKGCTSAPIISNTTGYTVIMGNLNAPMPANYNIPATSMKSGGDSVETFIANSPDSPFAINMLAGHTCYAGFDVPISKFAAVAGTINLSIQFMCYANDAGTIDFSVDLGHLPFGSNFTHYTASASQSGGSTGVIYTVDFGTLPLTINPNDLLYINVSRNSSDTFNGDIALVSALITYNSI